MDRMTSHEDMAELLGAYALDAVEPDEAELLARHVETCPRCREELRAHRETAALLGYIGGAAPTGLWDQIVASAQEPPPEMRLQKAQVVPIGQRRRRQSLRVRTAAAAASVAAAAAVVLGLQVSHLDHQTAVLNAQFQSITPSASMTAVRSALATPGSREAHLLSFSAPRGSAAAVLLPSGVGYLYDAQMQPLPSDRTYQLWGVIGDQRISYGLLGTDPSAVVPFRSGPGVQALAVTDEVAGGVEHSSQPMVAVGQVQAAPVVPTRSTPAHE